MKTINKVAWGLLGFLLGLVPFLTTKCSHTEPQAVQVNIPEVKGGFKKQPPAYADERPTVVKWDTVKFSIQNPVNDSLVRAYQMATDSLARMQMYLEAVQVREFTNEYSDSLVNISALGEVQGKLNWLELNYTLKPRTVTVDIPQPKSKWSMFIGATFVKHGSEDLRAVGTFGINDGEGNAWRLGVGENNTYLLGFEREIFRKK